MHTLALFEGGICRRKLKKKLSKEIIIKKEMLTGVEGVAKIKSNDIKNRACEMLQRIMEHLAIPESAQ